jgi:hypothetical protein
MIPKSGYRFSEKIMRKKLDIARLSAARRQAVIRRTARDRRAEQDRSERWR